MPAKLRVPDRYAPSLAEFLRLSPQEIALFLRMIREEQPNLALSKLADTIAGRLSIDRKRVEEIVNLLTSLQMAQEGLGMSAADLVAELRAAMEASGKAELQPSDWSAFEESITEALSEESALAVSSKARDVMQDHSKIYCYSRVLTDLRPIFKSDIGQGPSAFVTVHTLKIAYHENGEHKEFFVALDREDVKQLADLLARAAKKEDSLKSLSHDKGLTILEVNRD
jgi:hypothetical protein